MADGSLADQDFDDILDNDNNQDVEFWEQLREEGKITFQNSIQRIQKTRDRSIEFLKITLLLGSFYAAIYQFGFSDLGSVPNNYLIYAPFLPLFVAMFLFVYTYIIPGSHKVGANTRNPYVAIREDYNKLDYVKIMSAVYFRWGEENLDLVSKSIKVQLFGVCCLFSSLGAVAAMILRL